MEKIILLHEEFQKPNELIRYERMSRHLYDLERLMDAYYGKAALADDILFDIIIQHRSLFTPIKGVDYSNLTKSQLNFIPTGDALTFYENDYRTMREVMFYGNSLDFAELITRMEELSARLKS